jgi:5-methylcytosine-specific restriction protein A
MPNSPKVACSVCGVAGCKAHRRARIAWDHRGKDDTDRGYGATWRKIRTDVLARTPRCAWCAAMATCVDHRVPKSMGGTDAYANLQPLCDGCHARKTRQESIQGAQRAAAKRRESAGHDA